MKEMLETGPVSRPKYLWPLLSLGILAISSAAVMIKLCRAEPLAIAFYRLGFAAVLLWPAFIRQRAWRSLDISRLRLTLLAGVFLTLHFVFWLYSLNYTSVASSVVLVTLNPLFVSLLGWAFLGEKVSRRLVLAIILVISGGTVIGGGAIKSGGTAFKGNLLALGGALMASLYLLAGRRLRAGLGIIPYATICYTVTAGMLLLGCLAFGVVLSGFPSTTWLLFVGLALGPQILGHTVFNWGLKYLPASKIAMMIVAEPIGAAILTLLILGQVPTLSEVAGGALILIGVYLAASG